MNDQKDFMMEAIRLSEKNLEKVNGGPFGAIVVKNGKVVGKGINTVLSENDPTAHAEINAIRDACKNLGSFQLEDCELYSSCEPCPMCLGAIYWARPRKIYFGATRSDAENAGFDDSRIYEEINLDIHDRTIPGQQLLREEAQVVFEKWMNLEQKAEY